MNIDKPLCNLKTCRYCHDHNCFSADYEICEYTLEKRPHGEWIKKGTYFGTCWATCSVCNKVSSGEAHDNGFGNDYSYPNFCPKCGSDNRPREGERNEISN